MSANCDFIVFFRFTANLELFESRIPDVQSVKLTFSLTVTFYLIKPKTELNNLQQSSHKIALSKGTNEMLIFYKKNADISKIKRTLVLKVIFSETTYVCVLTYQICYPPRLGLTSKSK